MFPTRFIFLIASGFTFLRAHANTPVDFDRDIKPIFANHCLECHGPDKAKANLRLDDRASALKELKSGHRAIVPNHPHQSALLHRITSADEDDRMPPEKLPLSPTEISKLRQWIAEGAPWETHWAYRPLLSSNSPSVKSTSWPKSPIDHFILSKLESHNLHPSPPAESHILVRRLYYDLLGLSPDPSLTKPFLEDPTDSNYEKLVDHLLASPHFGERWARHWLDMARYADSDGYEKDNPRPDAWRYRDWVINAINADM